MIRGIKMIDSISFSSSFSLYYFCSVCITNNGHCLASSYSLLWDINFLGGCTTSPKQIPFKLIRFAFTFATLNHWLIAKCIKSTRFQFWEQQNMHRAGLTSQHIQFELMRWICKNSWNRYIFFWQFPHSWNKWQRKII